MCDKIVLNIEILYSKGFVDWIIYIILENNSN